MMRDSVRKMEKINIFKYVTGFLPCLVFFSILTLHPALAVTTKRMWSSPETGFALDGYDPVAYFTDARPRKGVAEFQHIWAGVAWRFVNEGNMQAFQRNPEVYAPQLGGYGAQGVAENQLLPPNPLQWGLYGKKLYLFQTAKKKRLWDRNVKTNLPLAAEKWKALLKTLNE